MAILGVSQGFRAKHGTREVRDNSFTVELRLSGKIDGDFVAGVDYDRPRDELQKLISGMEGCYLDDIVGRATNENIGLYLMHSLRGLNPESLIVREENGQYAEIFPSDVEDQRYPSGLQLRRARSLLMRERPVDAKDILDQLVSVDSDFAEAFNVRGRCQRYLGSWDAALLDFMQALIINPELGEAYRNLGNAYLYTGDTKQMIPAFTKAVELMPNSSLTFNNRGFAYQKLGMFKEALEDHNRAIELDPNYAEAYADRSEAFKALGMMEQAAVDRVTAEDLAKFGKDTYAGVKMY
jgi:tetratricopeptide (TPR) repeat protein